MPNFEPKRKLSEEQKVFLQDNHQLIYKGMYRINFGKSSPLDEEEINDCVANVVRQFCKYNPSISKQSTFIYRSCLFAYKGAIKKRSLCREKGFRKSVSYNCDLFASSNMGKSEGLTEAISIALHDAMTRLVQNGSIKQNPLHSYVAAISVGICNGVPVLDLPYIEDSAAEVDMNVVMLRPAAGGEPKFVEVQGTAEGVAFSRPDLDQLLGLADIGLGRIFSLQSDLLAEAPVSRPISR